MHTTQESREGKYVEHVELSIASTGLPVNSLILLNRLHELLKEHDTISLRKIRQDPRVRAIVWMINNEIHESIHINQYDEWNELMDELDLEV